MYVVPFGVLPCGYAVVTTARSNNIGQVNIATTEMDVRWIAAGVDLARCGVACAGSAIENEFAAGSRKDDALKYADAISVYYLQVFC